MSQARSNIPAIPPITTTTRTGERLSLRSAGRQRKGGRILTGVGTDRTYNPIRRSVRKRSFGLHLLLGNLGEIGGFRLRSAQLFTGPLKDPSGSADSASNEIIALYFQRAPEAANSHFLERFHTLGCDLRYFDPLGRLRVSGRGTTCGTFESGSERWLWGS
jgi:hypothetical protein